MCGIVGVLVKRSDMRPKLGEMMLPMFQCMADRGADSGGVAVFGEPLDESHRRFNLFVPNKAYDWPTLASRFKQAFAGRADDASLVGVTNHGILTTSVPIGEVRAWLRECDPTPHLLSVGRYIDVFKDMGHPAEIATRYGFGSMAGSHCVGHTRMATESAVTPIHAHPFTAGEDFCLVHNGSLSNPYMIRRKLEKLGIAFESDNDTEAACRFVEWRLREGDTIDQALHNAFKSLDGFYTLLMATPTTMTLVRDAFACKPAIVAETDDYVAVSSEFRSLAHLPGIADAKLFEPSPEVVYSWQV